MFLVPARLAVAVAALAVFGVRVAGGLWIVPLAFRLRPLGAALAVGLLLLVGTTLGAVGLAVLVLARVLPTRRPPALDLDSGRRRFVVPMQPRAYAVLALCGAVVAANLVPVERVPDTGRMRLSTVPYLLPIGLVTAGLLLAFALVLAMSGRPYLTLEPTGLAVWWGRRHAVGWDELAPGGPLPPSGRNPRELSLHRRRPGKPVRLPVRMLRVDPAFLAGVVRMYVENPARRAAIGTAGERDALALFP